MATRQEQIEFIRQVVVPAERVAARLGVPSNAVMAQWAMESAWGTSKLAKAANNFGGIKEWKGGPSVNMPTKEEVNGKKVSTTANFKKFTDINQYADEYANFLSGKRYDKVRGQKDPIGFANALAASGYATTNPREYSSSIIGAMKSVDRLLPEIQTSKPSGNRAASQPEIAAPGFSFKKGSAQMDKPMDPNTSVAAARIPNSRDATGDVIDWYKRNTPDGSNEGKSPFGESLTSTNSPSRGALMGKGMGEGAVAGSAASPGFDLMGGIAGLLEGFAGAGDSAGSNATNMMLADYASSLNKPTFDFKQPTKYKFPGFFNG
jgi:hypothetical protein